LNMKPKGSLNKKNDIEQTIKRAALALFAEKGFHATTTRDITEGAGVSKGSLYWYFRSKEDIAFSLSSDMLNDFLKMLEHARDERGDVLEKIDRLIKKVAELYYKEVEYLRVLWKVRFDRDYIFRKEYTEKVANYYTRIRQAIESIMEQGVRSGAFRPHDTKQMALILMGISEGLEIEWLENMEDFSFSDALIKTVGAIIASVKK